MNKIEIEDQARYYGDEVEASYRERSHDDFHGLITGNAAYDGFIEGVKWTIQAIKKYDKQLAIHILKCYCSCDVPMDEFIDSIDEYIALYDTEEETGTSKGVQKD